MSDKLGRTWKGRDIVWLRQAKCARQALYRWVGKGDDRKLIYDKLNGFCDKNGNDVRETLVDIIPALKGDEDGKWDFFPTTDEAQSFKDTLTYHGYINNVNDNDEDMTGFDEEFDDGVITIK